MEEQVKQQEMDYFNQAEEKIAEQIKEFRRVIEQSLERKKYESNCFVVYV